MKIFLNKQQIFAMAVSLIIGIFFGFLFFNNSNSVNSSHKTHLEENRKTIWTCSMHPQIRQEAPGRCPICGMELAPLNKHGSAAAIESPNEIQMSEAAVKLAEIQTSMVRRGRAKKVVQLFGKVKPNEKNISELTARFNGRIEKLQVNFTGQTVQRGQVLATIYSPELISAQQELLETLEYKNSNSTLFNATRNKLRLWDITDQQIREIEEKGKPLEYFQILSPINGTVINRHVSAGEYVTTGSPLFTVIDFSTVWVMFEAYENDLPWIEVNDSINFSLQSFPGEEFFGKVIFIDPVINPDTRIARIRVEVANESGKLKPEMFARGVIQSRVGDQGEEMLIPKTAVLWTGKRSLVYLKLAGGSVPTYHQREIELGPEADDFYIVKAGLQGGEEVVTNAVFKVDAAAQLSGKSSMMNPSGIERGMSGGQQHDMSSIGTEMNQTGNNMQTKTFWVGGNCSMCKDRIEKAAMDLPGVMNADWGIESKQVVVTYDPKQVELMEIHEAIVAVGHNTNKVKAPDEVYEKLPVCCLYRTPEKK